MDGDFPFQFLPLGVNFLSRFLLSNFTGVRGFLLLFTGLTCEIFDFWSLSIHFRGLAFVSLLSSVGSRGLVRRNSIQHIAWKYLVNVYKKAFHAIHMIVNLNFSRLLHIFNDYKCFLKLQLMCQNRNSVLLSSIKCTDFCLWELTLWMCRSYELLFTELTKLCYDIIHEKNLFNTLRENT